MAFFGQYSKEVLLIAAEDLGAEVSEKLSIEEIIKLITETNDYDEEFTKLYLNTVNEEVENEAGKKHELDMIIRGQVKKSAVQDAECISEETTTISFGSVLVNNVDTTDSYNSDLIIASSPVDKLSGKEMQVCSSLEIVGDFANRSTVCLPLEAEPLSLKQVTAEHLHSPAELIVEDDNLPKNEIVSHVSLNLAKIDRVLFEESHMSTCIVTPPFHINAASFSDFVSPGILVDSFCVDSFNICLDISEDFNIGVDNFEDFKLNAKKLIECSNVLEIDFDAHVNSSLNDCSDLNFFVLESNLEIVDSESLVLVKELVSFALVSSDSNFVSSLNLMSFNLSRDFYWLYDCIFVLVSEKEILFVFVKVFDHLVFAALVVLIYCVFMLNFCVTVILCNSMFSAETLNVFLYLSEGVSLRFVLFALCKHQVKVIPQVDPPFLNHDYEDWKPPDFPCSSSRNWKFLLSLVGGSLCDWTIYSLEVLCTD